CSSDLGPRGARRRAGPVRRPAPGPAAGAAAAAQPAGAAARRADRLARRGQRTARDPQPGRVAARHHHGDRHPPPPGAAAGLAGAGGRCRPAGAGRPARGGARAPAQGRGQAGRRSAGMSRLDGDVFDLDEARASRSSRVVLWTGAFLAVFLAWAWWFEVDEVSSGGGQVVPTSREQVIQSLEGGIVARLAVAEGDIVEKGELLAQLDPTRGESSVGETAASYRAALASSVRLQAEVEGRDALEFPQELQGHPDLVATETALFRSRRRSLAESLGGLQRSLELVRRELAITGSLVDSGAASHVELLRLQRQRSELELKLAEVRAEYMVRSREELSKANAEVESLSSVGRGRADSLTRLTLRSPVRGVVKDIEVTTIGGVVPPNGALMTIVP